MLTFIELQSEAEKGEQYIKTELVIMAKGGLFDLVFWLI